MTPASDDIDALRLRARKLAARERALRVALARRWRREVEAPARFALAMSTAAVVATVAARSRRVARQCEVGVGLHAHPRNPGAVAIVTRLLDLLGAVLPLVTLWRARTRKPHASPASRPTS